jgi:hypothetical protein
MIPGTAETEKTLDKIPFNETKNFVDRVWHAYERYKKLYSL